MDLNNLKMKNHPPSPDANRRGSTCDEFVRATSAVSYISLVEGKDQV